MHNGAPYYDCVIVGGGLAGLSLAAWLSREGFRTVVYEKKAYPFHKVCGEYLSAEALDCLAKLDIPFNEWGLPRISTLVMSGPAGMAVRRPLRPGGVGVSRFRLDQSLADAARASGADVLEQTRVEDIAFDGNSFLIKTSRGLAQAAVCCGAFGRYANFDVQWKRQGVPNGNTYIAVKYHALLDRSDQTIELHHFRNGYCGISPIEDGKHCICYLTGEGNLHGQGNDIRQMEENILAANPFLRTAFRNAVMLYKKPLTVSRINFRRKKRVENHTLMLGDAAGMIAPLCGNGMSMALHASRLAAPLISDFLKGRISRNILERTFQYRWRQQFAGRLRSGRLLQALFRQPAASALLLRSLRPFPGLIDLLVRQTHGRGPF